MSFGKGLKKLLCIAKPHGYSKLITQNSKLYKKLRKDSLFLLLLPYDYANFLHLCVKSITSITLRHRPTTGYIQRFGNV